MEGVLSARSASFREPDPHPAIAAVAATTRTTSTRDGEVGMEAIDLSLRRRPPWLLLGTIGRRGWSVRGDGLVPGANLGVPR